MEKKCLYTNYIDEKFEEKVLQALKDGYAVRIGANCIGHTRAAMIEIQGERLMEYLGAHIVENDPVWGNYYSL